MVVDRGFLRSYNLMNILYIYLILGGVTIKNEARIHTAGNVTIIFISKELASVKPLYNAKLCKSTVKQKYLTTSTKLLIRMRIFINFSLVAVLIHLSGDVETNPGPFNFEVKECHTRGLEVCHPNVRNLLPKIDSLRLFISKNPFDVIAISETWLKPSTTNTELIIPNYVLTRNYHTDKTGWGMAFYVRNGLLFRSRGALQSSRIETCWIEIISPKTKSLSICSAYRPPDFNIETFIEKLKNDLSKIQANAKVILMGDFNVDYQQRSMAKSHLQTLAHAFSFEQLIVSATRIRQSSKTTIDLIFANNIHRVVASGVYSLDISDHSLIFCVIKAGVAKSEEFSMTLIIVAIRIMINTNLITILRMLTGLSQIPYLILMTLFTLGAKNYQILQTNTLLLKPDELNARVNPLGSHQNLLN